MSRYAEVRGAFGNGLLLAGITMIRKLHVLLACALCAVCRESLGADLLVPAQFPTIQAAVDAAAAGDVVQVSPGTYAGPVDLRGKAITVRGTTGDAASVVVSGGESVLRCVTGETLATVVENLTITNGTATVEFSSGPFGSVIGTARGAGVRIVDSSPTIRNCRIISNVITVNVGPGFDRCNGYGAGMFVQNGSPAIVTCLIAANSIVTSSNFPVESYGAGVCLFNSSATISSCSITGNVSRATSPQGGAGARGAGVYVASGGRPRIVGCSISSNMCTSSGNSCGALGSGIALFSAADIEESIISENSITVCSGSVGGVHFEAIGSSMRSSRICGNTGSQSWGSYVNLGGNSLVPTCPSCTGDLTGDGRVDGTDLGILLARWGVCTN